MLTIEEEKLQPFDLIIQLSSEVKSDYKVHFKPPVTFTEKEGERDGGGGGDRQTDRDRETD